MTNTETLILCAAAAIMGYLYAKNGKSCGSKSTAEQPVDPLAWLGSWQA